MRGNTGSTMNHGQVSPVSFSRKKKLNTRSSNKSELVGVGNTMPPVLWARYLLEEKGYVVDDKIMFQKNMSTMILKNIENRFSTNSKKIFTYNIFTLLTKSKHEILVCYIIQRRKW